jgi:2-polyprenyl-3-methyl-5-hydroxy-6-metoxy-1,4-benzoquinol methylase
MILESERLETISRQFLPSRWHYYYARSKLATDPLYAAVVAALSATDEPLLDLGCGIGLLPHYCKASGLKLPYRGVDNDAAKIALARAAATRAGLARTQFDVVDLAHGFPSHQGSVTVLDMLQFLPPERLPVFLNQAAACVTDKACLIIRTGLEDASWRTRVTRAADYASRAVRWMNAAPLAYPTRTLLHDQLLAQGLVAEFMPLWGNTPFNNWLVVARRK